MTEREDIPQKILLENSEDDRRSSSEGSLVLFESDDYAQRTKQKIGDYFRREIEDANNQSSAVIADGPELDIFNDGDSNSANSFTAKFPDGQAAEARTFFENQSRSTTFDRDVLPGKQGDVNSESEVQASVLLSELRNDPSPIAEEVIRRIGENASFSPERKYISDPNNPEDTFVTEEVAGTRRHLIQPTFGSHGPKKLFGTVEVEEGVTPTLTIKQLQNLGCQILMESSGEVFIPTDPADPEQIAAARAATSAVPGVARLGFRVDANRFSATQVIRNNVDDNIRKPEVEIGLSSNAKASYGSVNNPYVPFAAVSSGFSSVVVGSLLSLTFSEIFIALSEILSNELGVGGLVQAANLVGIDETAQVDVILEKRKRLGSYVPREQAGPLSGPGEFGLALIGLNNVNLLVDTQFSYKDSLQEGVKVFFGIDNTSGTNFALGLAPNGLKIAESPGYYNGILRALTRAVADPLFDIVGNLIRLGGSTDVGLQASGPADVNPLIGPPSDPTSLLGIVNVIKESKFLKFMNILATIGDTSLKIGGNVSDIDATNDVSPNSFTGQGEPDLALNLAALHQKNRLSNRVEPQFRGALAWGANTVRSMFFMNDQILTAESIWANDTNSYSTLAADRNVKLKEGVRRFTQEEVKLMERELDSCYVPFYFHDLRTNEIIAFHAFINNIADSYDVEYNETDGYGRIGKVYTYKNTNRNIQLSFKVVSTNPSDFDQMWYKINKLTMLMFPQYTAGRAITFDSQKFIQPFSQIPSSSPLIRLRVGDLIKNNYSDFDLARLFGIGTESFQLSEQARERDAESRQNIIARKAEIRRQFENYEFNEGDIVIFRQPVSQVGSTASRATATSFVQIQESEEELRQRERATRRADVARRRTAQGTQRRSRARPPEIPVGAVARVVNGPASGNKIYNITFSPALPGTSGATLYTLDLSTQSAGLLSVPDHIINDRAQASSSDSTTSNPVTDQNRDTIVRNFFASDDRSGESAGGNPIFKSFDSTRGEGLAGVIKSMAFSWDDAIWETQGLNNRAPKWCTIDIAFAPVWDLNPGLDANGNMTGAPYNIGQILKRIKLSRNRDNDSGATNVAQVSQASVDATDEE